MNAITQGNHYKTHDYRPLPINTEILELTHILINVCKDTIITDVCKAYMIYRLVSVCIWIRSSCTTRSTPATNEIYTRNLAVEIVNIIAPMIIFVQSDLYLTRSVKSLWGQLPYSGPYHGQACLIFTYLIETSFISSGDIINNVHLRLYGKLQLIYIIYM